jgi:hypothetical protein
MALLRRSVCALLVALPIWLAAPASAADRLVTADINGDGVRDHVDSGVVPGELVVHLSGAAWIQRLRAAGSILQVIVADVDHDGRSDVVAAASGRRHFRLFIWTNTGNGKLVKRAHRARDALSCGRFDARPAAKNVTTVADDELCGDTCRLIVLSSAGPCTTAFASAPIAGGAAPHAVQPQHRRRSPRGPPASLPLS